MSVQALRDDPWRTKHEAYSDGPLEVAPAPEYASSEVLLSGLNRTIFALGVPEGAVPQKGRDLDRLIRRHLERNTTIENAVLDADSINLLLNSTLASPKLPNQSARRFLQVTPVVPATAVFSGAARTTGNPWAPGRLVARMIWLGSEGEPEALACWRNLFDALSVRSDDDIFARFLSQELGVWTQTGKPEMSELKEKPLRLSGDDFVATMFPARRFVRDLPAIMSAKGAMTRRQWVSLMEAVVRLASVSHVVWLCELHIRIWECLRESLDGRGPGSEDEVRRRVFGREFSYLSYGDRVLPKLRDKTSLYLKARLGINRVLFELDVPGDKTLLATSVGLATLCDRVRGSLSTGEAQALIEELDTTYEEENRTILCNKGIGANILEFARHALGQRQAAEELLRDYDQGYVLRKKSSSKSSPWVVALGPVATMALVHCSLAGVSGPRSIRRLSQHLAAYGMAIDHHDIALNDLGHQLRVLGLVLDSPDAESGMLLVPPFPEHTDD
jgi:hypothetical protein